MRVSRGSLPKRSSSGLRLRTYSVGSGMSAPLSRPKRSKHCGLWLRYTPGWICITMPSSTLMRAISVSIWPRNSSASAGVQVARRTLAIKRSRIARGQVGGEGGRMAVIGGGRAGLAKESAALLVRAQIAGHVETSSPVISPKRSKFAAKSGCSGSIDRVGPVGGDHPSAPAGLADRAMMVERVERALGRRQHLDVEPVEQCARTELRPLQRLVDRVVSRGRPSRPTGACRSRTPRRKPSRARAATACRGTDGSALRTVARSRADRSRTARRRRRGMPSVRAPTPWL